MFDGMHHQDQLFHQFISSSSSSPPNSSSSRPPPAPTTSLHRHHHHLQQINSPFPNFDNSSSSTSFPTPSTAASSHHHHHQSIQFHDLFHRRPNLPSFPHLNQASSLSQDHHLVQKDDVGHIRSLLLPPTAAAANLLVERERSSSSSYSSISLPQHRHQSDLNQAEDHDMWSNDEVVALLRIRSSSESSWFPPEFTWEHVSRKLAEIGFKRSAEKCKEKFEEESRTYFNTSSCFNINTNNTYNNNNSISGNKINNDNNNNSYKVFSELEEFCGDDNIENNNAANAGDDQVQDPINNNEQHQDMEVESSIGCEKSKSRNNNVFENITAAADEIEEDANYPLSPMHSQPDQPAEPHEQSDAAVDRRERQLKAKAKNRIKKRNKEDKLKKMKGLCERFVNMMMAQQEELHNKILDDLLKRDEDNIAREESWKWMENERLSTEIEMRALEQATAGDRQAAIIEFMNKFSTTTTTSASASLLNQNQCIIDENIVADLLKVLPKPISDMSKVLPSHSDENGQIFLRSTQNPSDETPRLNIQTLLHETLEPQTPTSKMQPNIITKLPPTSNSTALLLASSKTTDTNGVLVEMIHPKPSIKKAPEAQDPSAAMSNIRTVVLEDYGKRWPREEVLALIDLRCSFMRSNNNHGDNEADREPNGSKAPLWERISQKMFELGYKRSAKRCKEKWENINKYFRKTKDNVSKKRSLDSRTCPYFHQLSHLYKQGTLVAPSDGLENHLSTVSGNCFAGLDSLEDQNAGNTPCHVGELRIRPEDE